MKILNIVELQLLKIIISKFYLTRDIDYKFVECDPDGIIKYINNEEVDMILLQDDYSAMKYSSLIELLREHTGVPIAVFSIQRDWAYSRISEEIKKYDSVSVLHKDIFYDYIDSFLNEKKKQIAALARNNRKKEEEEEEKVILYVDDSKIMHHFVGDILKNGGYKVINAYDGREALEIYHRFLPGMVITDVEMPVMDGLSLCREIKENNDGRFIPVIILSSLDKPVDVDTGFNSGADDYLTKPVNPEKLLEKVEEYFSVLDRQKRNKVLLVEDSKMVAEIISHALKKNHLNVLTARDGREGYEIAVSEHPEVIITDLEMPVMNGYELVEKVKNTPELLDTSIIMISSRDQKCDIKKGEKLGVNRYFTKPFDMEKMIIVVEQLLLEKYKIYKKEYEYMLSSIKSLVKALEARDNYTKGHTERVSALSLALARHMGLSGQELNDIEIAANLHDIGKIGVSDGILLKSGKLTEEEYAIIQAHAVIGAEILKPIRTLSNVLPLILLHHERWDGQGYPFKKRGMDIPLGARIIAIADTYDAITSDRPYRKALTPEEAVSIIYENLGKQFCPVVGKEFIQFIKEQHEKKFL